MPPIMEAQWVRATLTLSYKSHCYGTVVPYTVSGQPDNDITIETFTCLSKYMM